MQLGYFSYMTFTNHWLFLEKKIVVVIFGLWKFLGCYTWVVSMYTGVVLGYTGTNEYDCAPRLMGWWQVVSALSILPNPPHSGMV
jgi:hypothetical protein